MSGLPQLHTYGAEYTLDCSTCLTREHLGYTQPDIAEVLKLHSGHDLTLNATALTFTTASKEDLELMRCLGCPDCEGEQK